MNPTAAATTHVLAKRFRNERTELGHLIAAIGYKRELVQQLGPKLAFDACRAELGVPGLERLRLRPIVSLREASRAAPMCTELWRGGRRHAHRLRHVVGESDHADQVGFSRDGFLTCLRDATIRGRSSLVLQEDRVVVDFETDELSRFEDSPEMDPGVLAAVPGALWMMEDPAPPSHFPEVFKLNGNYSHNFGHWIHEYLPKLGMALLAGLPERVPLLVDEAMPDTHLQALALFCPGREVIRLPHLAAARVDHLWCAAHPMFRGWYPVRWLDAWEGIVTDPVNFATSVTELKRRASVVLEPPTGVERLFLARRPSRKKRLVNHEGIEAIARRDGFAVVYPEDLGFDEQLRLANHARLMVAPDGSNSLLALYGTAGAKLCILNSTHTFPLAEVDSMLEAIGVELTVLTGPMQGPASAEPYWDDYRIDESDFERFLGGWL